MEVDDEVIQKQAAKLKKKNDKETVKNIYKFVQKTIEYSGYLPKSLGAKKALIEKGGDCTEFADLFVTLCRACSIPAKHITGYMSGPTNTPKHSWAEVYLDKLGWVQFEVTPGNNADFKKTIRGYIKLSETRNNEHLNYNSFYRYRWRGKSAPTVKNVVSVKEYARRK